MKRPVVARYRLDAVVTKNGQQRRVTVAYLKDGNGLIDGQLMETVEPCLLLLVPEYATSTRDDEPQRTTGKGATSNGD